MPCYIIFFNFMKDFHTVNRKALSNILQKLGCPYRFIRLIFALHIGMKASLSLREGPSETFDVGNRVNQVVYLPTHCSQFFLLWFCLMPSPIPPKEHWYRVDGRQTWSIPDNLSLQEMFWYTSSCLLILSSWYTTTKMHKK